MSVFIREIKEKFNCLYKLYENYAWHHPKTQITVIIQDNCISFYLIDEDDVYDELTITFEDVDVSLYHYLSLIILAIVLGDARIYQDDNELYNSPRRRNYVKMIVNDENILRMMNPILNNQDNEYIKQDMKYISNEEQKLKKYHYRKYAKDFLDNIDKRIDVSRKLLRGKK